MGKSIEKDGFKVEMLPGSLRVATLNFSPADAAKITNLLSWASNMASMKALPPQVGHTPFEVKFANDGNHLLHRVDAKGEVVFRFEQIDALVNIINHGVEAHKNQLNVQSADRLRSRGRTVAAGTNSPDIIDGRG